MIYKAMHDTWFDAGLWPVTKLMEIVLLRLLWVRGLFLQSVETPGAFPLLQMLDASSRFLLSCCCCLQSASCCVPEEFVSLYVLLLCFSRVSDRWFPAEEGSFAFQSVPSSGLADHKKAFLFLGSFILLQRMPELPFVLPDLPVCL